MGYPVVESIKSILPIVDEFVIGVGQSDDNTRKIIEDIGDPKIKIFDAFWDTAKTSGGLILSEKTNEALSRCQGTWCFYLQADEVVHQNDLVAIQKALIKHENDAEVEGLLFKYLHFYGSFDVLATARNWYRHEIRVIKNGIGVQSVGDAQGFRLGDRKVKVKKAGANIHHYGWVKPPQDMGRKHKHMFRWWHGNKYDDSFDDFSFRSSYGLKYFKGSHPAVMTDLVKKQSWKFKIDHKLQHWTLRDFNYFASDVFESIFRFRIGEYKNYTLLK